jgi:hypothetical protein
MSKKTTITDAARWLSEHALDMPAGTYPEFRDLFTKYMAGVQQQLKFGERFGWWLKDKHPKLFYSWYKKWWLKQAPTTWSMIYEGCEERVDNLTFRPERPVVPPKR